MEEHRIILTEREEVFERNIQRHSLACQKRIGDPGELEISGGSRPRMRKKSSSSSLTLPFASTGMAPMLMIASDCENPVVSTSAITKDWRVAARARCSTA
jgi:hypothetical protein